jgi:uncharacterized protein (TIGR02001 family)
MVGTKTFVRTLGTAGIALMALSGSALADDRSFGYSITLGATSDYVFRGVSFNDEDPAAQGSIDVSYGIIYAGIWGSNITGAFGPAEVDLYTGIKPVLGPVTFDFGVIYYWYPSGDDEGYGVDELDYVELKAGASISPIKNLTVSGLGYYSPDQSSLGETAAIEGTLAYTLPTVGIFSPTVSGTYGYAWSEEIGTLVSNVDEYYYWNAGLALAVEKFTFDFRYWDTDVPESSAGFDVADERFVFSAKVTLP